MEVFESNFNSFVTSEFIFTEVNAFAVIVCFSSDLFEVFNVFVWTKTNDSEVVHFSSETA